MKQEVTLLNYRNKDIKQRIREKVLKIIRERGIGTGRVVHEAGLHHATLRSFLADNREIAFVQLCKIENWVLEHEIERVEDV